MTVTMGSRITEVGSSHEVQQVKVTTAVQLQSLAQELVHATGTVKNKEREREKIIEDWYTSNFNEKWLTN